jgi:LuxR family maltose regulon positive regulatory protein
LILKAMALQALGDVAQALSVLQQALTLSEPDGFVLAFVDEGTPMAQLLYQVTECGIMPEYAGRLLTAFETTDEHRINEENRAPTLLLTRPPALIEPLTKRELEILELIAEGLSNRKIADRLVISVGTVKVHARNIYGKLQVSRRTEAVARAQHLGLL